MSYRPLFNVIVYNYKLQIGMARELFEMNKSTPISLRKVLYAFALTLCDKQGRIY